jgi:hypothetical protein
LRAQDAGRAMFEDRPEKYLRWYPLGVPSMLLREGPRVNDISLESVNDAALATLLEQPDLVK